jgi:hypothetical protein
VYLTQIADACHQIRPHDAPPGPSSSVVLGGNHIHDHRALLALRLSNADLSIDHVHSARVIDSANPRGEQRQVGAPFHHG